MASAFGRFKLQPDMLQRTNGRLWILVALSISVATLAAPAKAQVELIVRVADEGGETVKALLDDPAAARSGLLRGVEGVRRALPVDDRRSRERSEEWRARVFVLTFPDSAAYREAEARFEATSGVAYTQANGLYYLDAVQPGFEDGDPLEGEPYADSLDVLRVTRAVEAWAITTGDPSVTIGLLDTGLMLDHPDLAAQVWRNPAEVPGNGLDDDGNGYVDDVHGYDFVDRTVVLGPGDYRDWDADVYEDGTQDHGTLTAGVMSAALDGEGMAGTAPGCPVVVLRAFGRDGAAEDDDLAAALVYAADLGVDVINLSFGRTRSSPLLQEALQYADGKGTVLVASGGNVGGDAPHYPSDYPEVIGVVWLANDGLSRASVAQHGPGIAIGAPASSVLTTRLPNPEDPRPFQTQLYSRVGGSSLAAPQVAAAAALLRSIDRSLSPESIRDILTATAFDVGADGWDHETGAGLLDVAAALGRPFPGRIEITSPRMDGGVSSLTVPIEGSALAADFESYILDVSPGHDDPEGRWVRIVGPVRDQVRRSTLGTWTTEGFAEGAYTLRLSVSTRDGRTREVRHRITLDRSAPVVTVRYAGVAYDAGRNGVFVDLMADEPVQSELRVEGLGVAIAPEIKEEHGLFVPNTSLQAGTFAARVRVTNAAGLTAELPVSVTVPSDRRLPGLLRAERLDIPSGYLLPRVVDFDRDGLGEIVLNQAGAPGALGDTVVVYESTGQADAPLRRAATYAVPAIPRDVGDTDGDGRAELLFQVDPITLLVEASQPGGYPATERFRDEEGTTPTGTPLWGARLTDLDGDGRGEILGLDLRSPRFQPDADTAASTRWRVMERVGDSFQEAAILDNPTGVSPPLDRNLYQRPYGVSADFDGNGRMEWLTGDADGDLLLFETVGDDQYDLVWTEESDRHNAGQRMAVGDFNGDGLSDFATFTTEFTASDLGAPAFGVLSVWSRSASAMPRLLAQAVFPGDSRTDGSLTAADFDDDGRDEVVVQHALQLWVLTVDSEKLQPIYHRGTDEAALGPVGFSSPQMAVGRMAPGVAPSLFVSGLGGSLWRFQAQQIVPPVPRWVESVALNEEAVHLRWVADGDSVAVYASAVDAPFDIVARVGGESIVVPASETTTYALAVIDNGEVGPVSDTRTVRPHAPAQLVQSRVEDGSTIRLEFSERLDMSTEPDQFTLSRGEIAAVIVEGRRLVIRLDSVAPGLRELAWRDLRDREGTPVADSSVIVNFRNNIPLLYIVSVITTEDGTATLTFSEPVDPSLATDPNRYTHSPAGQVA
ncbi:MAG: S8 family serine peptidase, partial [Bacteroidota bacterium]